MNNLTQTQQAAKEAYLDNQRAAMMAHYQNANTTEKRAIIANIDSFLPVTRTQDEKNFWLKFRYQLERIIEQEAL